MSDSYLYLVDGEPFEKEATAASTGVGDAGKILALGADGKLTDSVMPATYTTQATIYPASEDVSAGDLLNIWDDSGTWKVRLASASTSRQCDGFTKTTVTTGSNCTLYSEGQNNQVSGLTPGKVFLGEDGATSSTPRSSGSGGISQCVGNSISATIAEFEAGEVYHLL